MMTTVFALTELGFMVSCMVFVWLGRAIINE